MQGPISYLSASEWDIELINQLKRAVMGVEHGFESLMPVVFEKIENNCILSYKVNRIISNLEAEHLFIFSI